MDLQVERQTLSPGHGDVGEEGQEDGGRGGEGFAGICCCSFEGQSLRSLMWLQCPGRGMGRAPRSEGKATCPLLSTGLYSHLLSAFCHFWVNVPVQLWALAPPYCPER